jgi:molybdopterin-synthase adenylyltransferase
MNPDNEQLIYSRQIGLAGWGAAVQEKLKKSTVFVAGAGGLGSPVMFYLAAVGIGNIVICDCDRVQFSNLNRQLLHSYNSVGADKVASAEKTIRSLNPFTRITPVKERITSYSAERLIGNADIILDCLDNFETRHVLNSVSLKKRIPMVHGGVAEMRGQITFLHPPETPCLACIITERTKSSGNHIVGATAGVIGSLQALEAIKYLSGIGNTLKNRMIFWDGVSMSFETIAITRNPRCKVCRDDVS